MHATITTFVVADAVGRVALETGESLRFGHSACKGFEPVIGASVVVREIATDARGRKARVLTLARTDTRYDALLAARDAGQGFPSLTMDPEQAIATARALGTVTVLLREPLPAGHQALLAWAATCGFPYAGLTATVGRDLELGIPGFGLLTYPGRAPFPREGLDLRNACDAFDLGLSFLGLGLGLPGGAREQRVALGVGPDTWAADGSMRQLTRLVRMLASSATGVVLHRAGELVVPIADLVTALGDVDHPECRPFAPWLDLAIVRREDGVRYESFGMEVFGLPDVMALVDPDEAESRSRGHEAVLHACYRMIRDNREWELGDTLEVPVGIAIGAWPVTLDPAAPTLTYVVANRAGNLELVAMHGDAAPSR